MYKDIPCNCSFRKIINDNQQHELIKIVNAEKTRSDNSTNNSFVVYIIEINNIEEHVKRRYSEFESFRKSLVKLYPTTCIPPIPEKHSLSDYTLKDTGAMIEKRKRMLERFLNRIASHPILNQEHIFHRFLNTEDSWTDIANTPPLSTLPKDPLLPNYFTISSLTSNPIQQNNSIIPVPSSSYTLKYPDNEFDRFELKVDKHAQQITFQFDKSQKRILKRLQELSNDYAELGSAYNGLSLNEVDSISILLEKIGQVIDGTNTTTKEMIQTLEAEFAEYVQEYTQYLTILKIESQKLLLKPTNNTEEEEGIVIQQQQEEEEENDSFIDTESIEDGFSAIVKASSIRDTTTTTIEEQEDNYPINATAPIIRWSSPRKLFSAVTCTIQGMIDTDPELTRRIQIKKLKLEKIQMELIQDLKEISTNMAKDFERLQIQKEKEIKSILIAFAKIHIHYCEQNTIKWKEMRDKIMMKDL
ncbi:uncharacterized protein BX663DRAFT_518824 [Cokeromyces recurvatus]|uniref:uncharacterized protein n=1 Tax=Cokeromyces recurvatus TaxID=90255 RepID=UPI002220C1F3|nr:uncharacterized protein BX663DRAFT_522339 [Cokeromyces recurvatus]XP_051380153.1 uncharacterized protein BX663DRAFT_518824 [Cokeromyces recurvatus]KAI7899116.1 hypothetical protein BX663DRAFT_522339 [Cokeromyces recurvatus]KAI7900168.1 hypothetical protein BX663DRAFT_518824 [Cokeromyces recurvatus]